ncbi:MAG: hypothetical protein COV74_10815 [Candidatus Omnitrophica bacterium CG11_big_fil_rev_8_21_14_0_20_45_26]|uniref:Cyclodeaminase/cyclohydrolase domain-containing protein n=1 Tax=Candidatus Abzuiibacterium crystallinum TaxID=1974748 RepID=A0A2H0LKY5_9BACT|nr:MAG: hypothetical protein COV74_10815 [Candidatus Omnitrophica bacterium CG11_big_fil_rev_8_21_14_0_20_45_26]PIW63843.1 MAG: hypothetical protein COW12_07995 [Candidatus Omnitrophica bacterium CG12_big_fil_rev_8_21_14_0_65_45_16]
MLIKKSLDDYLEALSSREATPGGGSASAAVGAMGAALVLMVAGITRPKLKKRDQKKLDKVVRDLKHALRRIKQIIDLDVKVYRDLIKSYQKVKNQKPSHPAARKQIQIALSNSFRLQADLALLIAMVKEITPVLGRYAKGSIANDLTVARGFLDGGFLGALATARINLVYMTSSRKEHFERGLSQLEKKYHGGKF